MTISTESGLITEIQTSLMDLSDEFDTPQLTFAANQALRELRFTLPVSNDAKEYWLILRGKRHALDLLRTTASWKFKYKQINLNQRFDQLHRLIYKMDIDFGAALKNEPELLDADVHKLFGTYISNGFIYTQDGKDISRELYDLGLDNDNYRTYPK